MYREKLFPRTLSVMIAAIITLNLCIPHLLPSAFPLTIEEQAKRKVTKKAPVYTDEFMEKATGRRDNGKPIQKKDPRLACLLSLIVPGGGGHIYLRKDLKGIGLILATMLGYGAAGFYFYNSRSSDASGSEKKSKLIISGLLFIVGVIIHVVGIVEAYNDAIDINEEKFYFGVEKSESPYVASVIFE